MKLAWICYEWFEEYEAPPTPVILFVEPASYRYKIIIPIVYAKIEEWGGYV